MTSIVNQLGLLRSLVPCALAAGLWLGGCANTADSGKHIPLPESETEKENLETSEKPALTAAYLSGDLGNYWDCPDEAATPVASSTAGKGDAGAPADEPAFPQGAAREDCDGDDCGGPMNCYHATLSVSLENTSAVDATNLTVSDIEILTPDGELIAASSAHSVVRLDGHQFDGALKAGDTVDLRVEFAGIKADWDETATIRVIIVTDEDATVELTSPELHGAGIIAT